MRNGVLVSVAVLLLVLTSSSSSFAAAKNLGGGSRTDPSLYVSAFVGWVGGPAYFAPALPVPSSPDNWLGGTGNWSNGAGWSAGEPGQGSDVFIATGNDYVTLDTSTSINSLTLGGASGSSTLADTVGGGYTVNIAGALTINQTGTLTLSDGDVMTANGNSSNAGTINLNENNFPGATLAINGSFTNSGGIQMNGSSNSITVSGNLNNTGSIQDSGFGGDTISVGSLTNSGSITLYPGSDSITANADSSNTGTGTITLGPSAQLVVNANFTNSGTINLEGMYGIGSASITVSGSFTNTNNGNINDVGAVDSLSVGGNLTNAGTISIANLSVGGEITNTGGITIETVPNPSPRSPQGEGLNNSGYILDEAYFEIAGDATNSGQIIVQPLNYPFFGGDFGAGALTNTGSIQLMLAGGLSVSGNVMNYGTITGNDGTAVQVSVGGRFTNYASGMLQLSGSGAIATIGNMINLGSVTVGNGATLTVPGSANVAGTSLAGFYNAGTVLIQSGGMVSSPSAYTQTRGVTTVDGELRGNINFAGGSVYGNGGTIAGSITSNGSINIGDAPMAVGFMTFLGNYTQRSLGSLTFDIASATSYDQLSVTGRAQLNGLMTVDLLNGYLPQIGNQFQIMTFASETGTFSSVIGLPIDSQEHFVLDYNSTNLTLDVVAGQLDGITATGLGGNEAFIPSSQDSSYQAWLAGQLSGSGQPSSVPEPSNLLLLGSGVTGIIALRRKVL